MHHLLSILIGLLFAAAVFSLLRRSLVKLAIGILFLSQAVNLLVFSSGELVEERPPMIEASAKTLAPGTADPLPQALVLTAIVIGFGLVAFTLALLHRAHEELQSDDINQFRQTEQ